VGWAIVYGEYEIHASVSPVRAGPLGIVAFIPLASVYRKSDHDFLIAEIRPARGQTFRDATAATSYIVARAKGMIDGDESALT